MSVGGIAYGFEDLDFRGVNGVTNFGGRTFVVVSFDDRIGTSEPKCGFSEVAESTERCSRLTTASSTAKCASCCRIRFIFSASALSLASILFTFSSTRL